MTIFRPMFLPRAESTEFLLPGPATGQRQTEYRTSESRKPAEGIPRRAALAIVAAAASVATIPAVFSSASSNADTDPMFAAIKAHQQAVAAHGDAVGIESKLEVSLPRERRQSDIRAWEETLVETDDPRWIAAGSTRQRASQSMDDLAINLLDIEIATIAGVEALLRYFVDQEEALLPEHVFYNEGSTETFAKSLIRHAANALSVIVRPAASASPRQPEAL